LGRSRDNDQDEDESIGRAATFEARVRDAQPTADTLDRDRIRGRIEARLFGDQAPPRRLGRYHLLDRVGAGGMGIVYSAYDPQLDRRVALKVLKRDSTSKRDIGRARLLREARALGQLTHPNVVPVHDVAVIDEQVVVVMEFVAGLTLAQWTRNERRSWRDIVAVYLQAARGLAAAHSIGMVHRDFKPDNALIGADERVRVVDFGLARFSRPDSGPGSAVRDDDEDEARRGFARGTAAPPLAEQPPEALTRSGAAMGTPRYMAPEQFSAVGAGVGPAADQFSFCVSLYRALFDQWPFEAGDSVATLAQNVKTGAVKAPVGDRGVPRRIALALMRGLRPDPADRYESMNALIHELAYDPRKSRRRWLVAGLALAAMTGVWAARGGAAAVSPTDLCRGGAASAAAVWSPPRRASVRAAIAGAGGPYARSVDSIVIERLDDYAARWAATHRETCLVHHREEESDELFDRRMACLDRRLDSFASVVTAFETVESASLAGAADAVSQLPPLGYCEDTAAMKAQFPPPEDPAVRAQVDGLRGRLSRALALEHLGRHREALAETQSVVGEAKKVDYPLIVGEAQLARGRVLIMRGQEDAAVEPLREAENIGLAHGQLALAIEASARRFYAQAQFGIDLQGLVDQARIVEPLSQRVEDGGFARPLLLNNIGVVNMALGERKRATRYFRAAYAELPAPDRRPAELNAVLGNLAMVVNEPAEREAFAGEALEQSQQLLGEHHPKTLTSLVGYSHVATALSDALARARRACESYDRHHPERRSLRAPCWYFAGFLHWEAGDRDAAVDAFERADRVARGAGSVDASLWAALSRANVALLRGELDVARRGFREVSVQLAGRSDLWWNRQRSAHAALGLGLVEIEAGRYRLAIEPLERAVATFADLVAVNEDVDHQRRLALSRLSLARAMGAAGGDRQRRASLLEQARRWYRSSDSESYRQRLDFIAEELAKSR